MPIQPQVPVELTASPFRRATAEKLGVGRAKIRGASWIRLDSGSYASSRLQETALLKLAAAALRLPEGAAFSGRTAAWLHGLDVDPLDPIDATAMAGAGVSGRAHMTLHRAELPASDTTLVQGITATTKWRTILDLGRRLPLAQAVPILDMALHAGFADLHELRAFVSCNRRAWGIKRLRTSLELVEPAAESPMESRLRLILVLGGLPRPSVQLELFDADGTFIARPDLLYAAERLAIEYDGGNHRDRLIEDNRRQNRLQTAGYRILRFTAPDLLEPNSVVSRVRAELKRRV